MRYMREKYIKNLDSNILSKNGLNLILPNIKNEHINICFVDTKNGKNNYCLLDNSTIFYYVIEGEGNFKINDSNIVVNRGDLIEIPPKNKYTYEGQLYMLEILSNKLNMKEVHEFNK